MLYKIPRPKNATEVDYLAIDSQWFSEHFQPYVQEFWHTNHRVPIRIEFDSRHLEAITNVPEWAEFTIQTEVHFVDETFGESPYSCKITSVIFQYDPEYTKVTLY